MNKMQKAARRLHSLGFKTLPIKPGTKVPATKHGVKDATGADVDTDAYYAVHPDHGIAVSGEGFVIFDFDVHEGVDGRDQLHGWKLPDTLAQTTPSGGYHIFYRCADEVRPSVNSEMAVDVRGAGSYVVCDPTPGYVFEDDCEIADADAAVMAFLEHVRPSKSKDKGTKGLGRPKSPTVVQEGGRNDYLFREGAGLRSKEVDDDVIAATIRALNTCNCRPPLPSSEVDRVVASVLELPSGLSDEAKSLKRSPGRPRKFAHNQVARALMDERGACFLDGAPAIRDAAGRYRTGWDAFDSAIIDMHDDCTVSNRKEVKAYIQARAPHKKQSPADYIGFTNGVLDVRDMSFHEWSDDFSIVNVIPHNWNPDAESELLDHVLERMACGDVGTLMNLTEFMGLCMARSVRRYPYFPVLIGEGANGKSTYIALLHSMLGTENISSLQPATIAKKFMGVHIVGKTANLGDDIPSGYLDDDDCSVIKSVATGDLMFTDVKGGLGFKFEPYCTMVFSCNKFPRVADTTSGFMRRLFPIEFRAVFTKADPDYDPLISEKLADESVLEYACKLGVEGLRRVIAQNGPTPNETSESVKDEIAIEGNTGLQWFNDEGITAEHLEGMTKAEAHAEYMAWAERNGYARTAMGSAALSALIGTCWHLKCTKSAHREHGISRKTVKVYERRGA